MKLRGMMIALVVFSMSASALADCDNMGEQSTSCSLDGANCPFSKDKAQQSSADDSGSQNSGNQAGTAAD